MVNNVVTGTYTETYDLNTAIGELSMLSIHTPQSSALRRMFKGFFEQYRKFRIVGCDFKMVCASKQELTPDLVGLEAGQIDPRDVLNPILFKACTGEHLNSLLDMIYNSSLHSAMTGGTSIGQVLDSANAAKDAYYQLLADDSWRKSHPQSGLTVSHLVPMVHKIVSTQPLRWDVSNSGTYIQGMNTLGTPPSADGKVLGTAYAGFGSPASGKNSSGMPTIPDSTQTQLVSNGLTPMPWLDTTYSYIQSQKATDGTSTSDVVMDCCANVPRVYMGCLILPPAILQPLYFRLMIRWIVQFKDFRPASDIMGLTNSAKDLFESGTFGIGGLQGNSGSSTYFNCYHTPSSKEINPDSKLTEYSSFETNESAEVEQIMEKVQ